MAKEMTVGSGTLETPKAGNRDPLERAGPGDRVDATGGGGNHEAMPEGRGKGSQAEGCRDGGRRIIHD